MRGRRGRIAAVLAALLGLGGGIALAKGKEPVLWAAGDVQYQEKMPGVSMATLWGNADKGAHGALVRFKGGTMMPLHTHSADIKAVVLQGTWVTGPEGGPEKKFGPGSYMMVPARWKHTSGCAAGADCLLFQDLPGKFDMKMVAQPKPAAAAPAAPAMPGKPPAVAPTTPGKPAAPAPAPKK